MMVLESMSSPFSASPQIVICKIRFKWYTPTDRTHHPGPWTPGPLGWDLRCCNPVHTAVKSRTFQTIPQRGDALCPIALLYLYAQLIYSLLLAPLGHSPTLSSQGSRCISISRFFSAASMNTVEQLPQSPTINCCFFLLLILIENSENVRSSEIMLSSWKWKLLNIIVCPHRQV